jgi:hypothetical protein
MAKSVHIITQGAGPPELPAGGREYTSPAALAYAEHHLILANLQSSLRSLGQIQRRISSIVESPEELHICESLFRDAVVQFVECFGNPKKNQLSVEDVFGHSPEMVREMAFLRDLRDGYAAHNHGPRRQCIVIVVPSETNFTFGGYRLAFSVPSDDAIPAYISLFETAIIFTITRCSALHQQVLQELQALTKEQILALPTAAIRTPSEGEIKQARKEFRGGRGRSQ